MKLPGRHRQPLVGDSAKPSGTRTVMRLSNLRTLRVFLTLVVILATGCTGTQKSAMREAPEIARQFESRGLVGTFVLQDSRTDGMQCYNCVRATTRFLPASTFKIPNALIALDTGYADGPDFRIDWDRTVAPRQKWWPAAWAKDHTLRSAFKASAVWYFQELARRIGQARMREYVHQFRYGNEDISGGIDQFWLNGGLRISAAEQVDFLQRFYRHELGVSERSTKIVKEILVLEQTPKHRLSGKTGWAGLAEAPIPGLGWLVGYLERDGFTVLFAMNVDIKKNEDAAARLPIVRGALRDLGYIQ